MWRGVRNGLVAGGLLALVLGVACVGKAEWTGAKGVPGLLDLEGVTMEIVGAHFVKYYEGVNAVFEETEPETYRGLLLTVRIEKPAGRALTLHYPDVSLHYNWGDDYDVAPCNGISAFSTELQTDRPMTFSASGWGKATTGIATTDAEVVYVDFFFQNMEAETSDLYICIGQPQAGPFKTEGWTGEEAE